MSRHLSKAERRRLKKNLKEETKRPESKETERPDPKETKRPEPKETERPEGPLVLQVLSLPRAHVVINAKDGMEIVDSFVKFLYGKPTLKSILGKPQTVLESAKNKTVRLHWNGTKLALSKHLIKTEKRWKFASVYFQNLLDHAQTYNVVVHEIE